MSLSSDYIKRLMDYLEREQILCTGEKLLLAVSGGADSTAMLYFYHRLRFVLNVTLLAVHVNHQLRGESSNLDEQAVRQQCHKLNIPLIVRTIDLPGERDLENRARMARFEIFSHIL
ncbi:MAG: ATP-binding protein, partial [Candidatus Cloacimonetes bacterium]|nr:ATP-binding protein [Candidatus Cloacimonadota bacterium]